MLDGVPQLCPQRRQGLGGRFQVGAPGRRGIFRAQAPAPLRLDRVGGQHRPQLPQRRRHQPGQPGVQGILQLAPAGSRVLLQKLHHRQLHPVGQGFCFLAPLPQRPQPAFGMGAFGLMDEFRVLQRRLDGRVDACQGFRLPAQGMVARHGSQPGGMQVQVGQRFAAFLQNQAHGFKYRLRIDPGRLFLRVGKGASPPQHLHRIVPAAQRQPAQFKPGPGCRQQRCR